MTSTPTPSAGGGVPGPCPVCGAALAPEPLCRSSFRPVGAAGQEGEGASRLWRCRACGFIFRDVDYSFAGVDEHFDGASYARPEYMATDQRRKGRLFDHVVRRASRRFPPRDRPRLVVDFGCSHGLLGEVFRAAGWDVVGVDRAPRLLAYHREHGAFPVVPRLDAPEIPEGGVDVIMMIDVLCYVEDPMALLRVAHGKLASPGLLYLRVPNRSRYLRAAAFLDGLGGCDLVRRVECDHKSHWTARTVRVAAAQAGFDQVRIRRRETGYRYPPLRKAFHWTTQLLAYATGGALDAATVFHAELWKGKPPP